jgi:hypothetical protein
VKNRGEKSEWNWGDESCHLSVRESTSIVYDAKWTIFSDWCVGREIDPFKISVQQLVDFLVFLFEVKGLER